jgi:glycyl-tRNA synthetase
MAEPKSNELMERIVSLCKRRGFVFQSSEIYGGIQGFWDYGPLGAELKRNVKELWWQTMTRRRDDVVGLEATIIMHPQIWRASGHVDTFSDPMSTCRQCKKLLRSDQVGEMLAESPWAQAIWELFPDGVLDVEKLRSWSRGKGARLAPGAALIRRPDQTLAGITELLQKNGPVKLERMVICQYVSAENLDPANLSLPCPHCGGDLTPPRAFNLMFKTYVGPVADEENVAYLRPETAQAIFAQFKNVLETCRQTVPFGIAQIGKAFRNEVTPRNFTFRSREFEQMELEFFIRPDEAVEALAGQVAKAADGDWQNEPQLNWGWEVWHKYWVEQRMRFYEYIGLPRTTLEEYWQKPDELAHYARATVDILFKFPFGTQELEGIAARGDFDLSQHQRFAGKSMEVFEEDLKNAWAKLDDAAKAAILQKTTASRLAALIKKGVAPAEAQTQADADAKAFVERLSKGSYVPHVIEPSAGADRLILALLCHAYQEETVTDDKGKSEVRTVMRFHPRVAPVKVGVFPLLKNKPELVKKATEVRDLLRTHMNVFYDDGGAIGRRYRRQDEAGTPFGVTIDFGTLGEPPELKDTVTLRHRDSMKQERIAISELLARILPEIR